MEKVPITARYLQNIYKISANFKNNQKLFYILLYIKTTQKKNKNVQNKKDGIIIIEENIIMK